MLGDKRIVVIMPGYNVAKTLRRTYDEVMATGIVDHVVLIDDASTDGTGDIGRALANVTVHRHPSNLGYGGGQKTGYRIALEKGADIVIMVHPDYQYTPKLVPAMASMITSGLYDCTLGSRILGGKALHGGMPVWKYVANRFLTLVENILLGVLISEYHTGYRAFSRQLLQKINTEHNSNDFAFDNQHIAQMVWHNFRIGELSCPAAYFPEMSTMSFRRGIRYGLACLQTAVTFRLARLGVPSHLFPAG